MTIKKLLGLTCVAAFVAMPVLADEPVDFSKMNLRVAPLAPQKAIKTFKLEKGLKIELVAAEPQITDPVAIEFDEDGRLYVCELWNYPYKPKAGEPLGRIRLLESTHRDGVYDKSTIFADNIQWPSGVACWKGGVFVLSSPDLLYLKDTDGDGKADIRKVALTGWHGKTYTIPNNIIFGPDNRFYGASSYAGGSVKLGNDAKDVFALPPGTDLNQTVALGHQRDWAFDPRTGVLEAVSGSGEWGNTFDDWGNRFIGNATDMVTHPVLPQSAITRNPYYAPPKLTEQLQPSFAPVYSISTPEPWKVARERFWFKFANSTAEMRSSRFPQAELAPHGHATAAAGITAYCGNALDPSYLDDTFTAEPANNLVVRMKISNAGAGLKASRTTDDKVEFLASTDTWFRPVNFSNGPDGCLYVVDMCREVIEDWDAIPGDILKHLDLNSGRDRGRIYRVSPTEFKSPSLPRLSGQTSSDLAVILTTNANGWLRQTAQRLIIERNDTAIAPALRSALKSSPLAQGRIQALWTLHGRGLLEVQDVITCLADTDPHVRSVAIQASEKLLVQSDELARKLVAAAEDPEPFVRLQVALRLGLLNDQYAVPALSSLAKKDLGESWIQSAILLSSASFPGELFASLSSHAEFLALPQARDFMGSLAQMAGVSNKPKDNEILLEAITSPAFATQADLRQTTLARFAEGLAKAGSSLETQLAKIADAKPQMRVAVNQVFEQTLQSVANTELPDQVRTNAISLLAFASPDLSRKALASLLEAGQSPAVQRAAVKALASQPGSEAASIFIKSYGQLSPAVRADVIDAMTRRPDRAAALVDAIAQKSIPAGQLDQARRQALLKSSDVTVREKAAKIFGAASSGDRQKVIDQYRAAITQLAGESKKGQAVFNQVCSSCHLPPQSGNNVGPRLDQLNDRSPDILLTAILDPNRDVKTDYVGYQLVTRDGQELSGIIVSETSTAVALRQPGGAEESVFRKNIASLTSSGLSLMPDGLEAVIAPQQMADLIAYLQTLR